MTPYVHMLEMEHQRLAEAVHAHATALAQVEARHIRLLAWAAEPLPSELEIAETLIDIGMHPERAHVAATATYKVMQDCRAQVRAILTARV